MHMCATTKFKTETDFLIQIYFADLQDKVLLIQPSSKFFSKLSDMGREGGMGFK